MKILGPAVEPISRQVIVNTHEVSCLTRVGSWPEIAAYLGSIRVRY
jgi:hypothetical protein